MKTYFSEIIPNLKSKSEQLDVTAILSSTHWIMVQDGGEKQTYIFRNNNDLLISRDGKVQKAKWEYLGNKSVLIDTASDSFLFKLGFYRKGLLALKVDNKNEYAMFYSDDLAQKLVGSVKEFERQLEAELAPKEDEKEVDTLEETFDTDEKEDIQIEEEGVEIKPLMPMYIFIIVVVLVVLLILSSI